MRSPVIGCLFVLLMAFVLSGCAVVGGIFKTGMAVGIFVAVLIVVLLMVLFGRR